MKNDAISQHECSNIIRHLAAHGKWSGRRLGAAIEMARYRTAAGSTIHYTVVIERHLVVDANCSTVAEAVRDINSIVHRRAPVPMAGRVADPLRTGQAHLVRERHRHAGKSAELWGE